MNPINGCETCEGCHDDLLGDEFSAVMHWDDDTDFNQVTLCCLCAIKFAKEIEAIRLGDVWFRKEVQ